MNLTVPSGYSGFNWRPLRQEDAAALHQLELESGPTDGSTSLGKVEDLRRKLEETGENLVWWEEENDAAIKYRPGAVSEIT